MKIGIDLGGSHIAIGVVDSNGRIIEKVEKRLKSAEKKQIKKSIEEYVIENIEALRKKYKIIEIGIAVPGTVKNGVVIKSVNLGIKNYNIVEELNKKIDLPIKIKNDAKCAAIAELTYGSLKNYKRSIFLTLGTGIGGAIIADGKLLDTGDLPGAEIGHMVIQKDGIACSCGKNGCFEKYASMKVLKDNLREALGLGEEISGKELFEIIRNTQMLLRTTPKNTLEPFGTDQKSFNSDETELKRTKQIESVVQEFIKNLSIGIANLINIFEPEVIGIGGSFVYFEEVLLDRLKEELLKDNALFNKRDDIIVKTAIFRNDAGIIGAVQ